MKSPLALAVPALISSTWAYPAVVEERQATNIDTTVLQFALTLEHLENVFYKQAIQKFSLRDFQKAGYSESYYNNLKYIAYDEQSHVQTLSGALQAAGVTPVQACTYNFPYNDVRSFITLSSVLEGVGTSAYLGGAPLITSKSYLTVAGSILVAEALHTSMQRLAIGEVPMADPYGTPLDPTSVYTLAAMFIQSCPASNAALPFKPFPTLQYNGDTCTCEEPDCDIDDLVKRWGRHNNDDYNNDKDFHGWPGKWNGYKSNYCMPPSVGQTVSFTANGTIPDGSYLTFVSGLDVTSVKGMVDGMTIKAPVPAVSMGQTYVFVSKNDVEGTFSDAQVLFGPAVLEVNPPKPTLDFSQA